ncbi:efflux RND transporter periplasmic adaptor subunit [Candidatus Aerophobetes bacterium]|nr:efflux RND transporter periplasmic adaptor subunit [Candidatus Aerophobetes bacterium]
MKGKIVVVSFIVLGFVFSGVIGFSQPKVSASTQAEVTREFVKEISLTADIAPYQQVLVIPKVSGNLEEINVDMGDGVEKGQVIAQIDTADIALQVIQAEAALISAKANYEKVRSMAKIQAENNLENAKAAFQSVQAQLDLIKETADVEFFTGLRQAQAALKIAEANLAKAKEGAREEEIQQVEGIYQQVLANFYNAERDLQRAEDDYNRGAIPEQALDKAKLGFEVARAQLTSAKANLELVKKGARKEDIQITEANVEQVKASLENLEKLKEVKSWEVKIQGAQTQWENARSALELAKVSWEDKLWEKDIQLVHAQVQQAEAAFELARSRLEDCTIKAPVSGIVSERFADKSSLVGPGQPLLSILDISSVKIVLYIGEEILDKVPLTEKIAVRIENYLNEVFTPRQINISPVMDPRNRKIKVEVIIPNPDLRIKPGMFARVKLLLGQEK